MMSTESHPNDLENLWARYSAEWRDPAQIASQWKEASNVDPALLRYTVKGAWWETIAQTGATLLVTREYEHLVMAIRLHEEKPSVTYISIPHPSGLVFDVKRGVVHLASTRNPNQLFDLAPVAGNLPRLDVAIDNLPAEISRPLVPVRSRFYPGCFYMHDLAMIGDQLHANSVGQNAVICVYDDGHAERVWWPRCIERENGPVFGQNHLQLNSIAAGPDLAGSFFSASTDKLSARRPGHMHFPVDRQGVIFSGATRDPIARGLTRPHSARLHHGQIWVDNSGYGEIGIIEDGKFVAATQLPGWTRGLAFHRDIAFVGTSRVIPRFRQYVPGLDVEHSVCGLHAVDTKSGRVLGSLIWPFGNQIFAIELIKSVWTTGFLFRVGSRRAPLREKKLFYTFTVDHHFIKDKES